MSRNMSDDADWEDFNNEFSRAPPSKAVAEKIFAARCEVEKLKRLRDEGISAYDIHTINGCSIGQLKSAGFSIIALKAAGFSALALKNAGFSESELVAAGFGVSELKAAGFTAKDFKRLGFSASQLRAEGFTRAELIAAGFPDEISGESSYLAEDTKSIELNRHSIEEEWLKQLAKVNAKEHSESSLSAAPEGQLQNSIPQHPWLATQRFDGIDPDLNPEPSSNPEAEQEFDVARNEQKLEQQLRLNNVPQYSTAPKPKGP